LSENPLFAVAFTPNGKTVVVGGDDGVVRRFDLDGRKLIGAVDLGRGPVTGLAALPDGTICAAAGSDVLLFREKTRELGSVGPLALSLAASPDGRLVAAGAWGKAVVWEVASGGVRQRFDCEGGVLSLSFGPGGKSIAIGTTEGRVRFYREGKLAWDRPGNAQAVRALAVSPDGKRILAGGDSPGIRIYRDDGREIPTPSGHFGPVRWVDHSPVAPVAASAGNDGMVLLWDLKARKLLHRIQAHSGIVRKVRFSADGRHVVSTAHDGTERIWVVTTGRPAAADNAPDAGAPARSIPPKLAPMVQRMVMGYSRTMTISPDGRTLVTGGTDGSLLLWNLTRLTD
jgi:WD40 repeat protein